MFFREFEKFILIFIIFGLWSTWINTKHKVPLSACSFLSILLSLSCFSSVCILKQFYEFNSLSNSVGYVLHLLLMSTHLTVVIESIFQWKGQLELIQKFINVDDLFRSKLRIFVPYRKEKREIFIRCFVLALLVIFVMIFLITYSCYHNLHYKLMYPSLLANMVMRFRLIQMLFWVYLVRSRYILIIYELKRIQMLQIKEKTEWSVTFDQLLSIKSIYEKLNESCELINKIFGSSLLVITMQHAVNFTFHSYWVYLCLDDFALLIISASLLVPIIVVFGSLAFYCTSCFEYVKNILVYF